MSEMSIAGVPWLNSQEGTTYPFAATASLTDASGLLVIPPDLFLDASLYPIGASSGLRLSRISVDVDRLRFAIGDDVSEERATAEHVLGSGLTYLPFVDAQQRDAGGAVIRPELMGSVAAWGIGDYFFTGVQTEWAARCVTPLPELGLSGILLDDGSVMTGDVWLVGETGVILETEELNRAATCLLPADQGTLIRIHAVGDPLFKRRLCEDSAGEYVYPTKSEIRSIRVLQPAGNFTITPDEYGRIFIGSGSALALDTILRVRTSEQGLVIGAVGNR